MGNKVLIVGGVAAFVLLLITLIVWAGVISAAYQPLPSHQAAHSSQGAQGGPEGQGAAKAGGEAGTDPQAKSRKVLGEDAAVQQRFHEGLQESSKAHQVDSVAQQKNLKEGTRPDASQTQKSNIATPITVNACNGGTVDLNVAEKQMLDLHNQTRAEHGLSSLCVRRDLTDAARLHSQDMLNHNYFSHTSLDGSQPWDRMNRFGYGCGRSHLSCGENLALGSGSYGTPEGAFRGLMNSPGHRENILRESFREVGIGVRIGSYTENSHTYEDVSMYTIDFGGP